MNNIYNCASYSRLSKEDDRTQDESSSISNQRAIISSFAKFNGLNIVKEYVDDGYSGGNFDRPAYQEMIDDIEKGKVNCVITKDLSRLGREIYKTGNYIEQYFTEKGVRYIAINDSYDSNIGDTMLGLRLGVNDLYLRDVSKKVKSSFKIKQQNGQYIGSMPCYGYIKDPDDKHHLIPDSEVVSIIKMIYDMALEGKSGHTIASHLTKMRIPIPIVYKKESRAKYITENNGLGIWRRQTVQNILTSQMYIGNMVQNTYNKISYNSKKIRRVNPEQNIVVENTHEGIIDKETFYKVQHIIKSRFRTKEKITEKYLLSGLLRCSECGHGLSISEKILKKQNSHYTQCNLYLKKGKYGQCSSHRLNYDWLEEDIINYIKEIGKRFLEYYDTENLIKESSKLIHKDSLEFEKFLSKTNEEINIRRKRIESLYNDKVDGLISVDTYKNLSEKNENEVANLNIKRLDYEKKLKILTNDISSDNYLRCKKQIESYMSMEKPNRTILHQLIEKIEVNEKREVDVFFKFSGLQYLQ